MKTHKEDQTLLANQQILEETREKDQLPLATQPDRQETEETGEEETHMEDQPSKCPLKGCIRKHTINLRKDFLSNDGFFRCPISYCI